MEGVPEPQLRVQAVFLSLPRILRRQARNGVQLLGLIEGQTKQVACFSGCLSQQNSTRDSSILFVSPSPGRCIAISTPGRSLGLLGSLVAGPRVLNHAETGALTTVQDRPEWSSAWLSARGLSSWSRDVLSNPQHAQLVYAPTPGAPAGIAYGQAQALWSQRQPGTILVAVRHPKLITGTSRMSRHAAGTPNATKYGPWIQQALHVSKDLGMVTPVVNAPQQPTNSGVQHDASQQAAATGSGAPGVASSSPFTASSLQTGAELASVLVEVHPQDGYVAVAAVDVNGGTCIICLTSSLELVSHTVWAPLESHGTSARNKAQPVVSMAWLPGKGSCLAVVDAAGTTAIMARNGHVLKLHLEPEESAQGEYLKTQTLTFHQAISLGKHTQSASRAAHRQHKYTARERQYSICCTAGGPADYDGLLAVSDGTDVVLLSIDAGSSPQPLAGASAANAASTRATSTPTGRSVGLSRLQGTPIALRVDTGRAASADVPATVHLHPRLPPINTAPPGAGISGFSAGQQETPAHLQRSLQQRPASIAPSSARSALAFASRTPSLASTMLLAMPPMPAGSLLLTAPPTPGPPQTGLHCAGFVTTTAGAGLGTPGSQGGAGAGSSSAGGAAASQGWRIKWMALDEPLAGAGAAAGAGSQSVSQHGSSLLVPRASAGSTTAAGSANGSGTAGAPAAGSGGALSLAKRAFAHLTVAVTSPAGSVQGGSPGGLPSSPGTPTGEAGAITNRGRQSSPNLTVGAPQPSPSSKTGAAVLEPRRTATGVQSEPAQQITALQGVNASSASAPGAPVMSPGAALQKGWISQDMYLLDEVALAAIQAGDAAQLEGRPAASLEHYAKAHVFGFLPCFLALLHLGRLPAAIMLLQSFCSFISTHAPLHDRSGGPTNTGSAQPPSVTKGLLRGALAKEWAAKTHSLLAMAGFTSSDDVMRDSTGSVGGMATGALHASSSEQEAGALDASSYELWLSEGELLQAAQHQLSLACQCLSFLSTCLHKHSAAQDVRTSRTTRNQQQQQSLLPLMTRSSTRVRQDPVASLPWQSPGSPTTSPNARRGPGNSGRLQHGSRNRFASADDVAATAQVVGLPTPVVWHPLVPAAPNTTPTSPLETVDTPTASRKPATVASEPHCTAASSGIRLGPAGAVMHPCMLRLVHAAFDVASIVPSASSAMTPPMTPRVGSPNFTGTSIAGNTGLVVSPTAARSSRTSNPQLGAWVSPIRPTVSPLVSVLEVVRQPAYAAGLLVLAHACEVDVLRHWLARKQQAQVQLVQSGNVQVEQSPGAQNGHGTGTGPSSTSAGAVLPGPGPSQAGTRLNWQLLHHYPSAARAAALWKEAGDWRKAVVLAFALHHILQRQNPTVRRLATGLPVGTAWSLTGQLPTSQQQQQQQPEDEFLYSTSLATTPLPSASAPATAASPWPGSKLVQAMLAGRARRPAAPPPGSCLQIGWSILEDQMGPGLAELELQGVCQTLHELVAIPQHVLGLHSDVYAHLLLKVCDKLVDIMPKRLAITPLLPSASSHPSALLAFSQASVRTQLQAHLASIMAAQFGQLKMAHGCSGGGATRVEDVVRGMLCGPEAQGCAKMLLRWQGSLDAARFQQALESVCTSLGDQLLTHQGDWSAARFMPILSTAAAGSLLLPQMDLDAVMDFVSTALRQAEGSAALGGTVMSGGHRASASELPSFQQRLGSPRGAEGDRLSARLARSREGLETYSAAWSLNQDRTSAGWGMGGAGASWASPPRGSMSGALNQAVSPPTAQPPPLADLNDLSLLIDLAELMGTLLRCIQPHAARVIELLSKPAVSQQSLTSILRGLQDPLTGRISTAGGPASTPLSVLPEVKEREELGSEPATETGLATAVGSEGGSEGQQPPRNPWSPDENNAGGGHSALNGGRRSSSGGGGGGVAAVLQAAVTAHLHQLLELEWALVCRNHVAALLQRVRELAAAAVAAQRSGATATQQTGAHLRHVDSWRDRITGGTNDQGPAGAALGGAAATGVAGLVTRSGMSVTYSGGSISRGRLGSTLNSSSGGGGSTAAAQQAAQALEAAELLLLQWTTALVAADTFHAETELQATVVSVISTVSGAGLPPAAVVELDGALRSRNIFNAKLAEQMTRLKAATRGNSAASIPRIGATIRERAAGAGEDAPVGNGTNTSGMSSPTHNQPAIGGLDVATAAGRKPSVTAPVFLLGGHAVMAPDAMRAQVSQATLALLREYAGMSSGANHTIVGGSGGGAAALQLHPQQQLDSRVSGSGAAAKSSGGVTATNIDAGAPAEDQAASPRTLEVTTASAQRASVTFLVTPSAVQGSSTGQYRGLGSSTPSLRRVGALGIDRTHDSKVALEELRCTSLLQCTLTIVGAHPRQFAHSSRRGFKSVHSDLCMCFKNPFSAPPAAVRAARAQASSDTAGAALPEDALDRDTPGRHDRLTAGAPGSVSMSAAAARAQHPSMLHSASARVPVGRSLGGGSPTLGDSMQDSGDSMGYLGQGGVFIADPQEELKALMTIPLWDTAGARGPAVALEKRASRAGQRPSQPGNTSLVTPATGASEPAHVPATVVNAASILSTAAPTRLAPVSRAADSPAAWAAELPPPARQLSSDSFDTISSDAGMMPPETQQWQQELALQADGQQEDAAKSNSSEQVKLSTSGVASRPQSRAGGPEPVFNTQAGVTAVVADISIATAVPADGGATASGSVADGDLNPVAQVIHSDQHAAIPLKVSSSSSADVHSTLGQLTAQPEAWQQVSTTASDQEDMSANIQRSIADMVAEALGSDQATLVHRPLPRPRSAEPLQGSGSTSPQQRGQVVGLAGSGLERSPRGSNISSARAAWADTAEEQEQHGQAPVAQASAHTASEREGREGVVLDQTMTPDVVSEEEEAAQPEEDDPYTNPLLKKHQVRHHWQQAAQPKGGQSTAESEESSSFKASQNGTNDASFLNPIASITIPTTFAAAAAGDHNWNSAHSTSQSPLKSTFSAPSSPFAAAISSHHNPFQHKHYNPMHQSQHQQRKSSRPPGMPTIPPSTRSAAGGIKHAGSSANSLHHGRASIGIPSPSRPSSRTLTTQTSAPAGSTSIHRTTWAVPTQTGSPHAAEAARSPATRKAHGRAGAASAANSPSGSPAATTARPRPRTAEKPQRKSSVSHTENDSAGLRLSEFLRSAASSTSMQASPLASPPINQRSSLGPKGDDSPGAHQNHNSIRPAATGAGHRGSSGTPKASASTHPARSPSGRQGQAAVPLNAGVAGMGTAASRDATGVPLAQKRPGASRSLYFNAMALEDAPPSQAEPLHPSINGRISNSPERDSTDDPLAPPIDGVMVVTSTFAVGDGAGDGSGLGISAGSHVAGGGQDGDGKARVVSGAYARRSLDKMGTYPRSQSPTALLNPLFVQSRRLRQSQSQGHSTP